MICKGIIAGHYDWPVVLRKSCGRLTGRNVEDKIVSAIHRLEAFEATWA
jgi:hypothetical protein